MKEQASRITKGYAKELQLLAHVEWTQDVIVPYKIIDKL